MTLLDRSQADDGWLKEDVTLSSGVKIYVEQSGTGLPVILLHGFSGDHTTMTPLATLLSDTHKVIVPDLVGHGKSSSPPDQRLFSVEAMASQIGELGERFCGEPFHLIGYSMGGRVAVALGCKRPELLRSLTLIGASAGLASSADREQRRVEDEELAMSIERDGLEKFVDRWMAQPMFATQARLGEDFLVGAKAQRLRNSVEGLARSLRAGGVGAMTPLHGVLETCRVPTAFIVGSEDAKFINIAMELASTMPNAKVEVMANAGHAAHLEQPKAVAQVFRDCQDERAH